MEIGQFPSTDSRKPIRESWLRNSRLAALLEGGSENSPGWSAAEPWECGFAASGQSRRDDRSLPPHVARIVVDAVSLQKREKLSLKIAFAMVLFLARDVGNRGVQLRPSDRKCAVSFLPLEVLDGRGFVHPMRGSTLDLAHRPGDRIGRRKRQQNVNVIVGASDGKRLHGVISSDSAHEGPQLRLNGRRNQLAPFFRREHAVKQRAAIGV